MMIRVCSIVFCLLNGVESGDKEGNSDGSRLC